MTVLRKARLSHLLSTSSNGEATLHTALHAQLNDAYHASDTHGACKCRVRVLSACSVARHRAVQCCSSRAVQRLSASHHQSDGSQDCRNMQERPSPFVALQRKMRAGGNWG
jgi:hypothetical protein